MPQVKKEQKRSRKPENQHKTSSFSASNPAESRIPFTKNPKKMRFMFVKLKGLGCKGTPSTASTPAIIRSAAEWEAKGARKTRNQLKKRKQPLHNRRNLDNVVVDVPDMCCTPPGIGIASDVVPRATNPAPRLDHRKHSREARRNDDQEIPAVLSVRIGSRATHRSAEEIIEMLMSRQALLPGRILRPHDQYQDWRLDVDDMSYEELLDLGDKMGYVGRGLQEAEISNCLKKFHHDPTSLLVAARHKDWRCSICQEKCTRDDEIGTLECGHHHHVECIKQWLLHNNACPVCKSAAMRHDKSK